jgi:uncharacterized protein YrrD
MKTKNKRVLKNGAIGAYVYYPKDKKWKWRIIGRSKKGGVHPNNVPIPNWMSGNKNNSNNGNNSNNRNNSNNSNSIKLSDFSVVKGKGRYFILYKPTKRIFYLSSGTSNILNYPNTFLPCFCDEYIAPTIKNGKSVSNITNFLEKYDERIDKCPLSSFVMRGENVKNSAINKSFVHALCNMFNGHVLVTKDGVELGKIKNILIDFGRQEEFPYEFLINIETNKNAFENTGYKIKNGSLTLKLQMVQFDYDVWHNSKIPRSTMTINSMTGEQMMEYTIKGDNLGILHIIPFVLRFPTWEDVQISSLLGGFWDTITPFKDFVQKHAYIDGKFIPLRRKLRNLPNVRSNLNMSNLQNYPHGISLNYT